MIQVRFKFAIESDRQLSGRSRRAKEESALGRGDAVS